MMKNSTAMLNLALLGVLSFILSFMMSSVGNVQIVPVLFAMIGVGYLVAFTLHKMLAHTVR